VRPVETLADAGRVLAASPHETLVVLGPGVDLEHALRFASDVRLSGVDPRLVLVRESVTPALRARAVESGVASVVAAADRVALAAAFRRARKPRRGAGQVITVLAARDGYGKTTVAIGLAAALPGRVCLLDLDLGFGDLASTLSLTPERSLAQAAGRYRAVTPAMLGTLAMPAWSDVDCVVAASKPGRGDPGAHGDGRGPAGDPAWRLRLRGRRHGGALPGARAGGLRPVAASRAGDHGRAARAAPAAVHPRRAPLRPDLALGRGESGPSRCTTVHIGHRRGSQESGGRGASVHTGS
jgi:hypothetical protein